MKTIRVLRGAALVAVAIAAIPAMAQDNSLTYQGVTFNTWAIDSDTLKLEILNAPSATGNWTGVQYLSAFEIKDIVATGGSVTGASIVSGPGFGPAGSVANGLNANVGCQGGGTPGACFTGTPIALTTPMNWQIDFVGTGLTFAAPHLKVQFLTNSTDTQATGNLLSQTIPPVPEPETYAMMLAGMGLVGVIARRRRAQ